MRRLFTGTIMLLTAWMGVTQGPAAEPLTGMAAQGRDLFNVNCLTCHQEGAHGQVGLAPSIRNPDFLALASDEFLRNTIKHGRYGTAMVARPDLNDAQVDKIIAFLRSVPTGAPRKPITVDWETRFTGDQSAGATKYATYCGACHGFKGEGYNAGLVGTAIGYPGFLKVASDDYILQTTKLGRIGTPMQPFVGSKGLANLSEQDIKDIIVHLRFLGMNFVPPRVTVLRAGNPVLGDKLFAVNCAPCHQVGGGGKIGFVPSIRNRDFLAIASDDFLKETFKKGRPGTAMMARPDLNAQQVADIIAYLRSAPGLPVKPILVDARKKFPGNSEAGAHKFAIYCASCHGPNGEGYTIGLPGSSIGLAGFLDTTPDDYIFQTLKHGRRGTPMKSFLGSTGLANLSEQDAFDIIAHLRTLPNKQAAAAPAAAGFE
jgi:mono/diheme cytochrome c family protein